MTERSSYVNFLDSSTNQSIDFGRGEMFIDPDNSLFDKPLSTTMEEASITQRSRSPLFNMTQ